MTGVEGFQPVMGEVGQDHLGPCSFGQRAPLPTAEPWYWTLHGAVLSDAQDRFIIKRCQ